MDSRLRGNDRMGLLLSINAVNNKNYFIYSMEERWDYQ
jgi:hypothetical protein